MEEEDGLSRKELGEAEGSMVSRSLRPSVWRTQRSRFGSLGGPGSEQNSGKRLRQTRVLMRWAAGCDRQELRFWSVLWSCWRHLLRLLLWSELRPCVREGESQRGLTLLAKMALL